VLLHGWPQHWYAWRRIVPLLSGEFRLIMPDLRGHGWSAAPDGGDGLGGYDKERLASDLLGLLDTEGLDDVLLVGHDWGGWAGFLACLREPQRFRGFVAAGITHPFQHPDARVLQSWRFGYQLPLATPVLSPLLLRTVPAVVDTILRGTHPSTALSADERRAYTEVLREPSRARASSAMYRTFLLRECLPVATGRYREARLQVPTCLVNGRNDPVITPSLLSGWERHADDMMVRLLPRCGHFVPEEAPEAIAAEVRNLAGRRG
jgi:pimeloyl-ACP methyl ester carboxylesterase